MYAMRIFFQSSRCGVYGYGVFHAAEVPEVRKLEVTVCRLVRKADGSSVSEKLGENGERKYQQ